MKVRPWCGAIKRWNWHEITALGQESDSRSSLHTRKLLKIWLITDVKHFLLWIVQQGARCYGVLMSWTTYFLLRAFGRCPMERSVMGTHWNRSSTIRHVLVSPFIIPDLHCWMEPIIKHTSKAAPHLSFRPEQTTLRTALCLFCGVEDETGNYGCFNTYTDDIKQRSWISQTCYKSTCLLFICKYNIADPVWTSASLQMTGGGWIYIRGWSGHLFFISNAPLPPSLDLYYRLSVMHDLTQRSHF